MGLRVTIAACALMFAGCGINTNPIPQDDAGGFEAEDAGSIGGEPSGAGGDVAAEFPDAGGSPAPPQTDDPLPNTGPVESCDVDLTCSDACPEDVDCDERIVARNDGGDEPEVTAFTESFPSMEDMLAMEAGSERWFTLDAIEGDVAFVGLAWEEGAEAATADPNLVLMLYTADDAMMGRTREVPSLTMRDMPATAGVRLRVVWLGLEDAQVHVERMQGTEP